ncbi:hypothetical protein [Verrucomicrobium spinosum]|uniref:hypothetical protein n=1 Tax=Verrucomicrobium spinosum TaxID=2736 RepID=UPI0001745E0C|nr:hypothetical protein [Verrucomicrobium spinosum]
MNNMINNNILYMLSHQPGSRLPKYVTAIDERGVSIFAEGIPKIRPHRVFVNFEGVEVMDRMLTSGVELILSEKTASILRAFKRPEDIVEIPCEIIGARNVGVQYFLWYVHREIDILNYRCSSLKLIRNHVLSVLAWAVDVGKVPNLDLFLGNKNEWFVSNDIVECVFREKLTGFGFIRVPCYDESEKSDNP